MASSADPQALLGVLEAGRRQFLALVADVRPELHRYCTRMTGSAADGEDVVQETLARAAFELSQMTALPPLRPWLFRIAHNRAIDHWRHESIRRAQPLDEAEELAADAAFEPESLLARGQAVHAALSTFLELAPAQRGCVILKDVLEHSLEEIGEELGLSVPAVKAALMRGRAMLQRLVEAPAPATAPAACSALLAQYARLFNVHDWDALRALLADDVRLDLVSQRKAAGRREVGAYFGNYERAGDWRALPARFDGSPVLALFDPADAATPRYFIALEWDGECVRAIRDFRYVPYIAQDGRFEFDDEGTRA